MILLFRTFFSHTFDRGGGGGGGGGPSESFSGKLPSLIGFLLVWFEHDTMTHYIIVESIHLSSDLLFFWMCKSFYEFRLVEALSNEIKAKHIPTELSLDSRGHLPFI